MTKRLFLLVIPAALWAASASAQLATFDAANFGQNLLTQINTYQTTVNQLVQLQNEAQMLLSGKFVNSAQVLQVLQQMLGIVNQQIAIGNNVNNLTQLYQVLYPSDWSTQYGSFSQYQQQWQQYAYANRTRITSAIQSVSDNSSQASTDLNSAMRDSETSVGPTGAAQAGNQIAALHVKEAMNQTSLMRLQLEENQRIQAERDSTANAFNMQMSHAWDQTVVQ